MGSPVVLGGGGRALLTNPRVSMPCGPQVPGWHLDPRQGAVHGCSGCSRGCEGPWQPYRAACRHRRTGRTLA